MKVERSELLQQVVSAIHNVKTTSKQIDPTKRLVYDYGLESIDIIDLFFEIQRLSGVEVNLDQFGRFVESKKKKKFNEITANDLVDYLELNQEQSTK